MKFILFLILLFSFGSCQKYEGGAIEIAWVIRGDDQHAYECKSSVFGDKKIDKIRLIIKGSEGEYSGVDICKDGIIKDCTFDCDSTSGGSTHRGVTSFNIPSGNWYIGISAIDENGNVIPSESIETPAPLLKTIDTGSLTFMGVWQIVVFLN